MYHKYIKGYKMIEDLLSIKGIKIDMNEETKDTQELINRTCKRKVINKLKSPFLECDKRGCSNEFTDLDQYIKHEIKCKSIDCDIEQIYKKLEDTFQAESIRSKFKFVQCEWCNKIFEDKKNRGKNLLKQHQTRGKNAGRCIIGYIRSKLGELSTAEALEVKELIDNL